MRPDPIKIDVVINIMFTSETVREIAEQNGIDEKLAFERVGVWRDAIAETMSMYTYQQLEDVIKYNKP